MECVAYPAPGDQQASSDAPFFSAPEYAASRAQTTSCSADGEGLPKPVAIDWAKCFRKHGCAKAVDSTVRRSFKVVSQDAETTYWPVTESSLTGIPAVDLCKAQGAYGGVSPRGWSETTSGRQIKGWSSGSRTGGIVCLLFSQRRQPIHRQA